jgi:arsenate reductase (thioredoxin)
MAPSMLPEIWSIVDQKPRVLFLSIQNSVRGQMAEGFLRSMAGNRFEATSGGIESADEVHPMAAEVMAEEGIDITTQHPKNVVEWFKEHFAYVITLADMAKERSPVFPFTPHLLHWSLEDPSLVEGSQEEKKRVFRYVRDEIKTSVRKFVEETGGQ